MSDVAPFSMQEVNEFPDDDLPPIRICEEPGCGEPCKKRGRGYARWCEIHLEDHKGEPASARPRSRNPDSIQPRSDKVAKKAEEQAKVFMAALQTMFIAKNDQYCAWALGETAEPIAHNLGLVASDFKFVANMIDKGDKYFALTMLTWNVSRLALMIGTHHELIGYHPAMKMIGVPEPPKQDRKLRVVDGQSSTDSTDTLPR